MKFEDLTPVDTVDTLHPPLQTRTTDYDALDAALVAIMKEWASSGFYNTRVDHIRGTLVGGLNGGFLLNSSTVHDDDQIDQLTGAGGQDLFFANLVGGVLDQITDKQNGEIALCLRRRRSRPAAQERALARAREPSLRGHRPSRPPRSQRNGFSISTDTFRFACGILNRNVRMA
ncbi:MAG TPA: hypothetical protein VK137_10700 [Planctomycetaceae bacterium]|nr:hypothetical protein [Planctomycetaceae bacterium]